MRGLVLMSVAVMCAVVCAKASAQEAPGPAVEKGLVAHWNFDEGKDDVLHDRSGNKNHGRIKGARWLRSGDVWALEFDGIDDIVDCGKGASLDLRKTVSMMAWVYPMQPKQVGEPGIVGKAYGSYVITQYGDKVYGYISGGPHHAHSDMEFNKWTHVGSTYDGKVLQLYVNGKLVSSSELGLKVDAGGKFWMGRSDGELRYTRDAHFHGRITEVKVYNRVLTSEEIGRHALSTNISNVVDVATVPLAAHRKILVSVDISRMRPDARPSRVDLALLKEDALEGAAQAKAVARKFDAAGGATVTMAVPDLAAGKYVVRAVARSPSGKAIGHPGTAKVNWVKAQPFPSGPKGARRLNNLVTELLNVSGPDDSGKGYTFVNPRRGWIYIANRGAKNVLLVREGATQATTIPLIEEHAGAYETMRMLPAGQHTISTKSADKLIVRAIPELIFARYGSEPKMRGFGPYRGAFHKKYVFKNVNTFVGSAGEPFRKQWKARGGKWLAGCSVPKPKPDKPLTVQHAYEFLAKHVGMTDPFTDGLIADEFGNSSPYCATYAKAVEKLLTNPKYKDKVYYPYANDLWTGKEGRELVGALVMNDCGIAWKRYLKEQRTEAAAYRFLNYRLLSSGTNYREQCPGSLPILVVCFGYFSTVNEQLDTFPHVNYKTWLEMEFNMVATDPAFQGVGGLMTYIAGYVDEEIVRWGARLFRHYGIEGRTRMLSKDAYILTHLENPDFEAQAKGWTVSPAEQGGIRFDRYPGFGWLQGRYPRTSEGDTVVVMKRSAKKPNVISQTIKDLEPGRLYSFRMFSGDFKDMSKKKKCAITVRIDNVEILPKRSFMDLAWNCYSHTYGPYDRKNKAWMNYFFYVFRAKGTTAKLTISDWAGPDKPGGPIGQEIASNFVQVQPYFAREEE